MYEFTEMELAIQQAVRQFVDAEIRVVREQLEFGDLPPYDILRKLWKAFGIDAMATDTVGKMLAKERARLEQPDGERKSSGQAGAGFGDVGGMGLILAIELSRVSPGLMTVIGGSLGLAANTIMARGTLAQKERWLPPLVTWEKIGAWGMTEPGSGSDAFGGMTTTVRRDGDGYRLSGSKTFITNAPYADTIVVFAKLDDGVAAPRDRTVLTFVLDSGMPGLTQSKPLRKMGQHSSPTGELHFDDVYLSADRLLGETEDARGGGEKAGAKTVFAAERIGVTATALGIIEECLDQSVKYARDRVQFGRPIGDYQAIQLKLARMEIARLNVQNMIFRAAEMARDGKVPSLAEASAMKAYASEAASEVAMEAVQIFGGNGYMSEYPVEQLARDAKVLMIYSGTNEIQLTQIAKDLLA